VEAGLTKDAAGRLYGTTISGGAYNNGAVFRLTPPASGSGPWTEEILHSFSVSDGASPVAGVLLGPSGEVYGVAGAGGNGTGGAGVVFRLDEQQSGWAYTPLHVFTGQPDGAYPIGAPVFGPGGLIYGVTEQGGVENGGAVFSVSPLGDTTQYAVIHSFGAPNTGVPYFPYEGLTSAGQTLFGTTYFGPKATAFALTLQQSGKWSETDIHDFGGVGDFTAPTGILLAGQGGEIYGCASGGPLGAGGVYSLQRPASSGAPWTETILDSFRNAPGDPYSLAGYEGCGITFGPAGLLYGTTVLGGTNSQGTFFKLTPPADGSTWALSVLYSFTSTEPKGSNPVGAPVRNGNRYYGGTENTTGDHVYYNGRGVIYGINPNAAGN
jgi:uncharacterized repeat protein (TIGR03803 family)